MNDTQSGLIMQIISNAGNGKSEAILAIRAAKSRDFTAAHDHLNKAEVSITTAHKAQTELLTKEANGDSFEINLLTIHSQDHLMNAITFLDMAKEMIDIVECITN